MKAPSTCLVTESTNVPSIVLNARLEHYFEMSKVDANEALRVYLRSCNQAEKVAGFLGVAKKLQNLSVYSETPPPPLNLRLDSSLLSVPIPNLKHFRSSRPAVKFSSDLQDRHLSLSLALWKNTLTSRTLSKIESSTRQKRRPQRKTRGMGESCEGHQETRRTQWVLLSLL